MVVADHVNRPPPTDAFVENSGNSLIQQSQSLRRHPLDLVHGNQHSPPPPTATGASVVTGRQDLRFIQNLCVGRPIEKTRSPLLFGFMNGIVNSFISSALDYRMACVYSCHLELSSGKC